MLPPVSILVPMDSVSGAAVLTDFFRVVYFTEWSATRHQPLPPHGGHTILIER